MERIIEFDNIGKRFSGVVALDSVSFSIYKGEVHVLVGENGAGKSTLMNILSGIFTPDTGRVIYNGKQVSISSPVKSKELGIATVYQELKLCTDLTVAENIFLGREIMKNKVSGNWKRMRSEAQKVLDSYGLEISPDEIVSRLSVAQMQVVEIARAISLNADVLILDEPTSSLTENETRNLFNNIRVLKSKGVTVIFISHRLDEVLEIADRISILKDGKYLGTKDVCDVTPDEIVALIAGKTVEEVRHEKTEHQAINEEVVLEVKHVSRGKYVKDVSFKLHRGEMLGFYGLQGAGRSELIETLFGMYRSDGGTIILHGRPVKFRTPKQAIKNGFAFVPEDRKHAGIFAIMSILENMAIVHDKAVSNKIGLVSPSKIASMCNTYMKKFSIKAGSINHPLNSLSGGNQQKVVIARGLSANPEIMLMDEPTRGIDVGAKSEIFKILQNLRENEGKSIIVITSEIAEAVRECDRVLVMRNGEIVGELIGDEINKQAILNCAFNGEKLENQKQIV